MLQINQAPHELLKTYFDGLYDAALTSFHSNFSRKLYKRGHDILFHLFQLFFYVQVTAMLQINTQGPKFENTN